MGTNLRSGLTALGLLAAVAGVPAMELGTNFWNPGWHNPGDCFRDVRNVTGVDPWNPQFLKEIAVYKSFRFMDWDNTNNSTRERWAERNPKSAPKQNPVAYEWMIDLCNRCGADLWVTVPHRSVRHTQGDEPSDYALRLCLLVKTGVDVGEVDLRPLTGRLATLTAADLVAVGGKRTGEPLREGLKFYVEYSNETWNGQFKQAHYCCDEGLALGLDEDRWSAGFRYHAWAALRVFRAADLVFGSDSPRVVKVLATQSANSWICGQHLKIVADQKWNPWPVRASAIAIAPYFGHKVDGATPDAATQLRQAIIKSASDAARHRALADQAGLKLIAYEGGQHVTRNAKGINRNPVMYDLYLEYLRALGPHVSHFCHYAHVGQAGDRGAWGAIEYTGQVPAEAHRYRALVEWANRTRRDEE